MPGHSSLPKKSSSERSAVKPNSKLNLPARKQPVGSKHDFASELEGETHRHDFVEGSSVEYYDGDHNSLPEESDEDNFSDADAPRTFQWVDDDDDMDEPNEVAEKVDNRVAQLQELESNLTGLPLGALRRAQRILGQAKPESDSDSDAGSEKLDEECSVPHKPFDGEKKEASKPEWSIKPRSDISKRSNKHAPTEVTSKKPVTRRRTVVEVKKTIPRDPRFLSVAGEFSEEKFQKQYSFLADAHKTELDTLKDNLRQARKLLSSSPRDVREEREQEVARLEFAVKRVESIVNKDRRDKIERDALNKVTKEEKEKRKQGKGGWWMKETDKRQLLARARYEALAADGGTRAVKKAIEKKQKKISQKEKKSRPFPKGGFGEKNSGGIKRSFGIPDAGYPPNKRRKTSE